MKAPASGNPSFRRSILAVLLRSTPNRGCGWGDGDQLYFDLADPGQAVYVYVHEHGPVYEVYAPSFTTALYRMAHERQKKGSG